MNEETRQLLLDILRNTERLDKITVDKRMRRRPLITSSKEP